MIGGQLNILFDGAGVTNESKIMLVGDSKIMLVGDIIKKLKRCLEKRIKAKLDNTFKEKIETSDEVEKFVERIVNSESQIYGDKLRIFIYLFILT